MVKITPLGARVLLEPIDIMEQSTESGIIIPGAINEKGAYKAEVIAKGDQCERPFGVGDIVLISQFAGDQTKGEGAEKLILLDEVDVLAIVAREEEPVGV